VLFNHRQSSVKLRALRASVVNNPAELVAAFIHRTYQQPHITSKFEGFPGITEAGCPTA